MEAYSIACVEHNLDIDAVGVGASVAVLAQDDHLVAVASQEAVLADDVYLSWLMGCQRPQT